MWVLKESAIKLNRGSISADLHNWQIELTRNIAINKSSNVSLKSFCLKYKNWYLGTASETINLNKLTPIICDDL